MNTFIKKIRNNDEPLLLSVLMFFRFICSPTGLKFIKNRWIAKRNKKSAPTDIHAWYTHLYEEENDIHSIKANQYQSTLIFTLIISVKSNSQKAEVEILLQRISNQTYNKFNVLIICNEDTYYHSNLEITYCHCKHYDQGLETAIKTASGTYWVFLDASVYLADNALFKLMLHLESNQVDIAYFNEIIVNHQNKYTELICKPFWSPHTFYNQDFIGNSFAVSKKITQKVSLPLNKIDPLFHLLLQIIDLAKAPNLIHTVMLHRLKKDICEDRTQLLFDHLNKTPNKVHITPISIEQGCYKVHFLPIDAPLISVIIPTKDQVTLLKNTVESVLHHTDYKNIEIIIIDNNSKTEELQQQLKEWLKQYPLQLSVIQAAIPFNFATLMNLGVQASRGQYVCLLNNDITVIDSSWLTLMLGYAQLPNAGAIGAQLRYPDDTIQHAGIIWQPNSDTAHNFIHLPIQQLPETHQIYRIQNYMAVTAACLLVNKEKYQVQGMDTEFAVEYNDIDFCFSLLAQGYYNIYMADALLYHYESATRGHPFKDKASYERHLREQTLFISKWQHQFPKDLYHYTLL